MWQYTVLPFGVKTAPQAFQEIVSRYTLGNITDEDVTIDYAAFTAAYIDDILIYTDGDVAEHIRKVELVLARLGKVGLRVHAGKSKFLSASVPFLGFQLQTGRRTPQSIKTEAIRALLPPTTNKELKSKLQFLSYYRCFMPTFSQVAEPLLKFLNQREVHVT